MTFQRLILIGGVVCALLLATAAAAGTQAQAPDDAGVDEHAGDAWLGIWLGDAVDGGVQVLAIVPGGPDD